MSPHCGLGPAVASLLDLRPLSRVALRPSTAVGSEQLPLRIARTRALRSHRSYDDDDVFLHPTINNISVGAFDQLSDHPIGGLCL